jgi:archaellum component FlaC
MTKDIDNIKKILIAIAEDLKSLDTRINDIECNFDTIDMALDDTDRPLVYYIEEDTDLIEDQIKELFSLIDRVYSSE